MKTELNRMGRNRLFPLLFQNGCSQSSRFLPQARRIVGSGDENAVFFDFYDVNMSTKSKTDSKFSRVSFGEFFKNLAEL